MAVWTDILTVTSASTHVREETAEAGELGGWRGDHGYARQRACYGGSGPGN
jgi:hypothetical protein